MTDDSTTYGSFYPFIEGYNYPVSDDFPQTLATADILWHDAYINRLLGEDYQTNLPAIETTYSDFHQSSDLAYGDLAWEIPIAETRNSAFTRYKREPLFIGIQSTQEKQKLIKRCLDFLRGMDKSRICRSSEVGTVNARMVEESNAYTHMMAERKRRNKLNQHFMDLRSLLPQNYKRDRYSILSGAILQLNHLKRIKEDLEQKNKALLDMYRSISEGSSSSSLDGFKGVSGSDASTTDAIMSCVSDEAVVVFEKSNIPDQYNLQVTLKREKASAKIDVIFSLLNCLRKLKLEVLRFHSDSDPHVIEATICTTRKGKEWQISQNKYVEAAVERGLHLV